MQAVKRLGHSLRFGAAQSRFADGRLELATSSRPVFEADAGAPHHHQRLRPPRWRWETTRIFDEGFLGVGPVALLEKLGGGLPLGIRRWLGGGRSGGRG